MFYVLPESEETGRSIASVMVDAKIAWSQHKKGEVHMFETKKCDGKPLKEVPKRRSSQASSPIKLFSARGGGEGKVRTKALKASKGQETKGASKARRGG